MAAAQLKACSVCFGILLVFFVFLSVTIIPAGNVGVVDLFGAVRDEPLPSGLHFVNPFARVVPFSVQTQIINMQENVPTKEGLTVHLEAAALVALLPNQACRMYKTVGRDYIPKVVIPQFRSIIREVTSGHDAKDLYTATTRLVMGQTLKSSLHDVISTRGIVVQETPLKKLELPPALQKSIEDKLQAEQASQKMQFVLDRERQEAERKAIEAEGIANFQRIVSGDITEGMLRWKGIEATELLAQSPNTRIIIVGNPKNGLPLILNTDEHEIFHRWQNRSDGPTTKRRKNDD